MHSYDIIQVITRLLNGARCSSIELSNINLLRLDSEKNVKSVKFSYRNDGKRNKI